MSDEQNELCDLCCEPRTGDCEGLCAECYETAVWCEVCGCYVAHDRSDELCRHTFEALGWAGVMGCGSVEHGWAEHKESFFAVLKKTGLAAEIREAMRVGKYRIYPHGPVVGTIFLWCQLGDDFTNVGWRFTDELTEEERTDMWDGVGWLMSLEPGVTKEAEQETIRWIDEWLALQPAASGRQPESEVTA